MDTGSNDFKSHQGTKFESQYPGKNIEALLYEPTSNFLPIPAVCFDLDMCEHNAQCPVIYVKQNFLLVPKKYSPYWSVAKDDNGRFIVKSNHRIGEYQHGKDLGKIAIAELLGVSIDDYAGGEYRTFIWKVTDTYDAPNDCWVAVFAD